MKRKRGNAASTVLTCVCVCVFSPHGDRPIGARLGGPAPPRHLHAVPHGLQRVEGRAHVQDGELVRLLVDLAVVVVDDVTHLLPAAVDDPVVAVEGQLVPEGAEPDAASQESLSVSFIWLVTKQGFHNPDHSF